MRRKTLADPVVDHAEQPAFLIAAPPLLDHAGGRPDRQVRPEDVTPQQVEQHREDRDRITRLGRAGHQRDRSGEDVHQPGGHIPDAETRMPVTRQPGHVRGQHRVKDAQPEETPARQRHAVSVAVNASAPTSPQARSPAGPSAAQVIERYAARWSVEVAVEDSKQIFGCGQAGNRTARAVRRTIPFQLTCQTLAMTWYATAGHDPADVDGHRARAPWYRSKAQPSTADMIVKLRRVLIAAKFRASHPSMPTPEEISAIRLAWEEAAA